VWNLATKIHIISRKQELSSNHRPNQKALFTPDDVSYGCVFSVGVGIHDDGSHVYFWQCYEGQTRGCDVWNPSSRLSANACVSAWLLDLHLICTEPGSCVINVPLLFPISSILSVSQRSNDKLVNSLAPTRHIIRSLSAPKPFLNLMLKSYV